MKKLMLCVVAFGAVVSTTLWAQAVDGQSPAAAPATPPRITTPGSPGAPKQPPNATPKAPPPSARPTTSPDLGKKHKSRAPNTPKNTGSSATSP